MTLVYTTNSSRTSTDHVSQSVSPDARLEFEIGRQLQGLSTYQQYSKFEAIK
jgi:hypothetical protein